MKTTRLSFSIRARIPRRPRRKPRFRLLAAALAGLAVLSCPTGAALPAGAEGDDLEKASGFLTYLRDADSGRIFFEIDRFDEEFLYAASIAGGLGSFETQLDRNRLGRARIVRFQRAGDKVFLVERNTSYRSRSEDPDVRKAVEDSFAGSILWGFRVESEKDGRVRIEAGPFLLRDAVDAASALRRGGQGDYRADESRSAVHFAGSRNFPGNTEIQALVTLTSDHPGPQLGGTAPDPRSLTLRLHHTFCALPDGGYAPRPFDPRSGFEAVGVTDHAAAVGEPILRRYIIRHRLRKKDPSAPSSEAVEPIVYYVDRGAPEPVRSAILEGVGWWKEAFEAIGYRGAFRAELLPEGVDPLDIRYNVVSWVHRKTRGWSYASRIIDPRTGELIKSGVVLESQRIRQDYLMAQSLIADYGGEGGPSGALTRFALDRIRQLACHEVGHNLGLDHNFASSADGRASVMDYPHPLVSIGPGGRLDISDAYAPGVGAWDKAAVSYGYQDFPPGTDEEEALRGIIAQTLARGLRFMSNRDAVPDGSAHPQAHRWDNGADPVSELERIMAVRAAALESFSEQRIRPGTPLAELADLYAPLYFFHRYQIIAAAKSLGGMCYSYALKGDGQPPAAAVPAADQRRALAALVEVLDPVRLSVDERVLRLFTPRPAGASAPREAFPGRTGLSFDPVAAAETLADLTAGLLLHPERAARLVEFHARNSEYPGFDEVLSALIAATWGGPRRQGLAAEIQRAVELAVLRHVMLAASGDKAAPAVRASAWLALDELEDRFGSQIPATRDRLWKAHYAYAAAQIQLFKSDPGCVRVPGPLPLPASVHNPPLDRD